MSKRWSVALVGAAVGVSLAACGTPGASSPGAAAPSGGGASASGEPYKVGLVYSKTGALSAYGAQYRESFTVGLDYATKGTGAVNGHKVEIAEQDDAARRPRASRCRWPRWPRTTRSSSSPDRPPRTR